MQRRLVLPKRLGNLQAKRKRICAGMLRQCQRGDMSRRQLLPPRLRGKHAVPCRLLLRQHRFINTHGPLQWRHCLPLWFNVGLSTHGQRL